MKKQVMSFSRKRPFFVMLLLFAVSFTFILVLLSSYTSAVDSSDQSKVADRVKSQIHQIIEKETAKLNERMRFLEEDLMFKSAPKGIGKGVKDKRAYPPITRLLESDRKRILVTGGSGFVGSHLVDQLMRDGHEVTVIDNFFTGRKRNVEQWIGHENFELVHHDIVNPIMLEVDQIYHLASPASPVKYMYNPIKTLKTNTVGTLNMLGLAKRVRAKILFASTSEVYGDPEVHPQHEEYWGHVNPIGPRSCYDEGKRAAEAMVYAYSKQENVDVRVARIFNTYGPRMHMYDGRVVSNFIIQGLLGNPLTIYSPGNQTRSFMYVSDLVSGLIALMNGNYSLPVNLGNPEEHTIKEFAQIILDLLGTKGTLQMRPHNEDDPYRRKPDITKAQVHLQWAPTVPLNIGIKRTIDYFRREIGNSNKFTPK